MLATETQQREYINKYPPRQQKKLMAAQEEVLAWLSKLRGSMPRSNLVAYLSKPLGEFGKSTVLRAIDKLAAEGKVALVRHKRRDEKVVVVLLGCDADSN